MRMPASGPFPGMDPWLEQHWGDVHQRMVTYACDQLQPRLPVDLRARLQERVFVETDDEEESRSIYPDVQVVQRPPTARSTNDAALLGTNTAEPLIIHLGDEPVTESFIEIIDTKAGGRIVTVIELLSIANKIPGKGQDLYVKQRQELEQGRVNLVEIDLLRAGQRIL